MECRPSKRRLGDLIGDRPFRIDRAGDVKSFHRSLIVGAFEASQIAHRVTMLVSSFELVTLDDFQSVFE